MICFPNAKINIGLNITEKRKDGYHNLETMFYPIPLEDSLEIIVKENNITPYKLFVNGTEDQSIINDNIVTKAYQSIKKDYDIPPIEVYLTKQIPHGAGLGGGSADAAFMLKLMNEKFCLGIRDEDLEIRAGEIGADCPFFIRNKPTLAFERGDKFKEIDISLAGYKIILIKPNIHISTKEAFDGICPSKLKAGEIERYLKEDIKEWKKYITNDFEKTVFAIYPELEQIKNKLYDMGAIYASMSGTGSTIYGLFDTEIGGTVNINDNYFIYKLELK